MHGVYGLIFLRSRDGLLPRLNDQPGLVIREVYHGFEAAADERSALALPQRIGGLYQLAQVLQALPRAQAGNAVEVV